jgi:hypothetical protein
VLYRHLPPALLRLVMWTKRENAEQLLTDQKAADLLIAQSSGLDLAPGRPPAPRPTTDHRSVTAVQ